MWGGGKGPWGGDAVGKKEGPWVLSRARAHWGGGGGSLERRERWYGSREPQYRLTLTQIFRPYRVLYQTSEGRRETAGGSQGETEKRGCTAKPAVSALRAPGLGTGGPASCANFSSIHSL